MGSISLHKAWQQSTGHSERQIDWTESDLHNSRRVGTADLWASWSHSNSWIQSWEVRTRVLK